MNVCVAVLVNPPSELAALECHKPVPPGSEWKNASIPNYRDIQTSYLKTSIHRVKLLMTMFTSQFDYISSPLNPHDVDQQKHCHSTSIDVTQVYKC